LDAILLTRESVGRERVIGGGIGEEKCRVGDGSGIGACMYLLMEQGPVSVSTWSRRTKRRRFHFSAHALDCCSCQDEKGTCPLQLLVLFASEEVSITTNFVCPSITYDELAA
jgi:hypothetical protein